jgi:hypothetical protein
MNKTSNNFMQQEVVEKRNQKEILIRKASSKSLLQPH